MSKDSIDTPPAWTIWVHKVCLTQFETHFRTNLHLTIQQIKPPFDMQKYLLTIPYNAEMRDRSPWIFLILTLEHLFCIMSSYKMFAIMSYAYQSTLINQELKPYLFANVNLADAERTSRREDTECISRRCNVLLAARREDATCSPALLEMASALLAAKVQRSSGCTSVLLASAMTMPSFAGRVEPQLNGSRIQGGFELDSNPARNPVKSLFLMKN
jgi:hypothetical protein